MHAPALRPLALGEILDVGIKIVFRHAWTLIRIALVVIVPIQILVALVDASATGGSFTTGETDEEVGTGTAVAGFLLVIALSIISYTVATGACFKAVADAYLGERPSWRDSIVFALRRFHAILWITILAYVLGGLALLALIIPGIWLFVAWSVTVPALMAEDVRGLEALGRSFRLVRGFWWRTFAVVLLGTLLAAILGGILGAAVGAAAVFGEENDLTFFIANAVASTAASAISTPLTAAFITVLYVDLRVRKEGFDIQLLADRIGREAAPPPEPPYTPRGEDRERASGDDA